MRRKPRYAESEHGRTFFRWCQLVTAAHPELDLIYHVPNGGRRGKVEAAIMKAEGVRKGMPDYHLPVARAGSIGLWIELKAPGGRVSKDQNERMDALRAAGHRCVVAVGWTEARDHVLEYLNQEERDGSDQ